VLAKLQKWSTRVTHECQVLSLPIQVLVYAGCSCQCQGRGLAGCCPQSVGRCLEAGGVIKQLLISQRWVQVPIIVIFLSLEWLSMRCWSPKDNFKSQLSTKFWNLSSLQKVADFSWANSSFIHRHFVESWVVLSDLLISWRWVQVPIINISRSSAAGNFGDVFSTDERCLFFIHQKPDSCQARTFEFCWLMTGHVSFGWGDTSYNQVFSCKQFGDFFSTDEQGLPSCKSGSQVLRVIATVLSLPVQVLVHPNAKAAAWWHRPQLVGRCL